ncbi:hypothetical protein JRQ81_011570 [Phrynocephalus forsythii]|uniref:Uncharacterized protein n=1 Tax=Phrynocephalus forsythii TaxID=171643 RepID=A0A9Q1AQ95_9SAUR|nr:hypothetical protein JRQ81_011570 [Phrynocephalus forsythii]
MKLLFGAAVLVVSALCVDAQGNPSYGVPSYGGPESPGYSSFDNQGYPPPSEFRPPEYPVPPEDTDFGDSSPPQFPSPKFPPPDFGDSLYSMPFDIFGWVGNLLESIFSRLRNLRFSHPRVGGQVIIARPGYIEYLPFGPPPGYLGPIDPDFPPFYRPPPFHDMPFPGQPEWPSSGFTTPPSLLTTTPNSGEPPLLTSAPNAGEPPLLTSAPNVGEA